VPANVARFCVTHASWDDDRRGIEDLLVALPDKLWKGKRESLLEGRTMKLIAGLVDKAPWDVFGPFDAICEEIAEGGPARLVRSRI
jgi:hypothetical protein